MQSRNSFVRKGFSELSLIFDPSKSHHYRVVCFRSVKNSASFLVYDSETHTWKDGGECDRVPYKFRNKLYWNGGIFFIGDRESSFCLSLEGKILLVPHPPRIWASEAKKNYIMESNGHLHCLSMQHMNFFKLLEMNGNDNWVISPRAGCIYIPLSVKLDCYQSFTEMDLLGMIRVERAEDSILLFHVPGKIMIYRFSNEVCEVLVDFTGDCYYKKGRLQFRFKDAHPFVESLAPV